MLANEKLLSVFVTIVFKKTNAFDTTSVVSALELIVKWFQCIENNNGVIPASFDFSFFFKGVDMLMDLDHAISGSKCLWMLYKILHIFPLDSRWILVEHLFGERFYRLFFHWSWNIRQVFYHLFLYQLVFALEED